MNHIYYDFAFCEEYTLLPSQITNLTNTTIVYHSPCCSGVGWVDEGKGTTVSYWSIITYGDNSIFSWHLLLALTVGTHFFWQRNLSATTSPRLLYAQWIAKHNTAELGCTCYLYLPNDWLHTPASLSEMKIPVKL